MKFEADIKQEIEEMECPELDASDRLMGELEFLPYFHGDIDRQRSVKLLANCPALTFLVRLSSQEGTLTLSVRTARSVIHTRIHRTETGLYFLEAPVGFRMHFTSLQALISFYRFGNRDIYTAGPENQLNGHFQLAHPLCVSESQPCPDIITEPFLAQCYASYLHQMMMVQ